MTVPASRVVNLTKQPLTVHDTEGRPFQLPPDPRHLGVVAGGDHRTVEVEEGRRLSVNVRAVQEIKGMPEPEAGTMYVVDVEVAMALQGRRTDVVFASEERVPGPDGRARPVTHLRRIVPDLD